MSSAGVQVGDADEPLTGEEAPCRKRVVAAPLREPFAVTSDDPSVSAFDGMLVGFFGGVLGGFVVGGAASSGGLDIALDAELGAVVGIVLGVFVVMLAAMGRRVLQRRRPRHPSITAAPAGSDPLAADRLGGAEADPSFELGRPGPPAPMHHAGGAAGVTGSRSP